MIYEKDYGLVKDRKWRYIEGYAGRGRDGGGIVFMHQIICPSPEGLETDHRFGDKLDNRSDRLRPATRGQNMYNKPVAKNNICGIKGLSLRSDGSYAVRITVDKVTYSLGTYWDKQEAIKVRRAAEIKYHGDFRMEAR